MVMAVSKAEKDAAVSVDYKANPVDNSKTGGWLAAGLILGTELSERICVMGISMNLVTYLTRILHLSSSKSANTVTNFMGALNILALFGGFLADAKLGHFLTIAIFASICAVICKTQLGLRNTLCTVQKEEKGWWKRLMNSEEKPAPYLKVDWNRWCDEDDESANGM